MAIAEPNYRKASEDFFSLHFDISSPTLALDMLEENTRHASIQMPVVAEAGMSFWRELTATEQGVGGLPSRSFNELIYWSIVKNASRKVRGCEVSIRREEKRVELRKLLPWMHS